MKRFANPPYYCKPIFPRFFWKECLECGEEFRNEKGWKHSAFRGPVQGGFLETSYLCCSCYPNQRAADNRFKGGPQRPPLGGSALRAPAASRIYECHECKEGFELRDDNNRTYLIKAFNGQGVIGVKAFHEKCFLQAAGEEYMIGGDQEGS